MPVEKGCKSIYYTPTILEVLVQDDVANIYCIAFVTFAERGLAGQIFSDTIVDSIH